MAHPIEPSNDLKTAEYINENIQTVADLRSLDSLLKKLREQQELQKQRLREAEEILNDVTRSSEQHTETIRKRSEAFEKAQHDIDRRLSEATQSKSSDEATQKFEASIEKLRRLEIANGYMKLLNKANTLSKEALSKLESSPGDALHAYIELKSISFALKPLQAAAEGAAPHLLDYISKAAENLKETLRKSFSENLRNILKHLKWPSKELQIDEASLKKWAFWVDILLQLQEPDIVSLLQSKTGHHEIPVLLPLEEMVYPLDLRLKYHFSGDKPTNRLDKPEYFLSHIIDLINTYSEFFGIYLQPILQERSQVCSSELQPLYTNAVSLYISALLPIAREKVNATLPHIANQPRLLSHFIHELMQFDTEIRDTWGYLPAFCEDQIWKGLTWEILVRQDWFAQWLQVEKDFALSRYQDIIDAPDSGEIDYDGVEGAASKPTKAAIRVNDLLETITDRYRPLSSFSQKLRFLMDIQIAIFDLFHERLHSGLEAYLAMTSTIGRTVQGSSASQLDLEGTAGLERLCRIFGSAEYLEKKMQDWGDDVFFLELWYELQDRVRQNAQTGRPVAGTMSISEVAARTSSSVSGNNNEQETEGLEGALFDETSSAYRRIRIRSESIIASALSSNMQTSLKPYSRMSTWASLGTSSEPSAPSMDLAQFTRNLNIELKFLSQAIAPAPLRRIVRQFSLSVQTYLWDNILSRHSFSATGAKQFSVDFDHICTTIDACIGTPFGESETKKVCQKMPEGLLLLGLKIKPSATDGVDANETGVGLWEAEKRLFANNESAREVLKELGIEMLTEAQGRSILERRVELRG